VVVRQTPTRAVAAQIIWGTGAIADQPSNQSWSHYRMLGTARCTKRRQTGGVQNTAADRKESSTTNW
jgi:hypothetical protein